jgi:hypothetical protein
MGKSKSIIFKLKNKMKRTSFEVICGRVSRAVAKRDKFLKRHHKILNRYNEIEQALNMQKYYANEKCEMLAERGKMKREDLRYSDDNIEVSFRSNNGLITIDIFEKMRYTQSNK